MMIYPKRDLAYLLCRLQNEPSGIWKEIKRFLKNLFLNKIMDMKMIFGHCNKVAKCFSSPRECFPMIFKQSLIIEERSPSIFHCFPTVAEQSSSLAERSLSLGTLPQALRSIPRRLRNAPLDLRNVSQDLRHGPGCCVSLLKPWGTLLCHRGMLRKGSGAFKNHRGMLPKFQGTMKKH